MAEHPRHLTGFWRTQFAVKAMELVVNDQFDQMVALKGDQITSVPMDKVAWVDKNWCQEIPSLIEVALAVGTSLGQKLN